MAPIRVDIENKKREILQAAYEVFSKKGFHNASVSDIAHEAGIAKGSIYDYFHSKDDLFLSLLDFVLAEFFEEFVSPPEIEDPVELLRQVFLAGLEIYQERENLLKFFIFYWGRSFGSADDSLVQEKLHQSFERNRRWIEKAYLKGVREGRFRKLDPAHVSASLMAMAEFIPMQWVIDKKAFSLPEAGKAAFEIWLKGISRASTEHRLQGNR